MCSRIPKGRDRAPLESEFRPLLLAESRCDQGMRSFQVLLQLRLAEAVVIALNPLQPARRQVRRRPATGGLAQHFPSDVGHLEGDSGMLAAIPSADRKDFSAHLPHMRSAPLHDMGGRRKAAAKRIEFAIGQRQSASSINSRCCCEDTVLDSSSQTQAVWAGA